MILDRWLMLIISLPGRSGTPRMRVWRALKSRGAGILRDGVYLLPAADDAEAVLRELAERVREAGGSAQVIEFSSHDDPQNTHFRGLFDRAEDYRQWTGQTVSAIDRLRGMEEPEGRRLEARLRRDLEAIVAIDYFPGKARERAAAALGELEAAVNRQFSPDEPGAVEGAVTLRSREDFQGRRWATRRNIWIDRVASAWLIRRFIDSRAQFLWLDRPADCPGDAVGFDFDGAEFTHVGSLVSFEVLLLSFGLDADAALTRLGALVRYLDVGGAPVPEAAGLLAMLAGAREEHDDDDALLDAAGPLFDHLYAAYGTGDET